MRLTARQRDIVNLLSTRGEAAVQYTRGNRAALTVLIASDVVRWVRADANGRNYYALIGGAS